MVTKGQGTESSIKRYRENALIYLAYFQGRNEKIKQIIKLYIIYICSYGIQYSRPMFVGISGLGCITELNLTNTVLLRITQLYVALVLTYIKPIFV